MSTDKKVLRKEYLAKLKNLAPKQRELINHQLQKELFQHPKWQKAKTIGITISQSHEWDTWPIIERAWQENKNVVVPKCYPENKQMTFYQIKDKDDLAVQFYNLLEPLVDKTIEFQERAIDLLIVPGLIFDHNHYRIGHGGGYYDRFLMDFEQDTISLVWQGQLVEKIKNAPYDQRVKELIIARD